MTAGTRQTLGRALGGVVGLLEELRVRDFTPGDSGEWFDLAAGCSRVVRVVVDDGQVTVHVLSGNGVSFWQVSLSDGTPLSVVTAVIDQAVAHVAARTRVGLTGGTRQGTARGRCLAAAIRPDRHEGDVGRERGGFGSEQVQDDG